MIQNNTQTSKEKMYGSVKRILSSKKSKTGAFIFAVFLILFVFSIQAQENRLNDMKKYYQNYCARCHGKDGSAVGDDGKKLKGEDFIDQKWRDNTKDEKMVNIILNGKFFGLAMPAFKEILTKDEAQLIVKEIIRKSEKGKIIAPDAD